MSPASRRAAAISVLLFPWIIVLACGEVISEGEPPPGSVDGGGGEAGDSTGTNTPDGASNDATKPPSDSSTPPLPPYCHPKCAGKRKPCGVRVGGVCIDSTEVTVGDYRAFADENSGQILDAGAPCPAAALGVIGASPDDLPITSVSFCEARAYCQWAGKRLCGGLGGGSIAVHQGATQVSAWFNACTGGVGTELQLITNDLEDGGCRFNNNPSGPRPANGHCEGSIPGVFDMIGNVWEWGDALLGDGPDAEAAIHGWGYQHPASLACQLGQAPITTRLPDIGFRCCSSLVP